MKKIKSLFLNIAIGLLLVSLSLAFFLYFANYNGASDIIKENKIAKVDESLPEITIQGVSLQQVSDHKSYVWKLDSGQGKVYKKSNKIECNKIICSLIKDEEEVATIESESALVYRNQNKAYLSGPIDCVYPGIQLTAKNAVVDLKDNTVTMTDGVKSLISIVS